MYARQSPDPSAQHRAVPGGHNIAEIVQLEQRDELAMTGSNHLASAIAAFAGSMLFFWVNAVFFSVWLGLNLGWAFPAFDPFPFGLLTVIVSLEAIFLSTFVLIAQNRQALLADRRANIDLQVNMLAEQETTKLIQMVAAMQAFIGMPAQQDAEVRALQQPTHVEDLANAMDAAEAGQDPKGARGPASAIDTEA